MITFSRLEKKGNLGNQLFQIASVMGIAKNNGQEFSFPKWSYGKYFQKQLPVNKEDTFNYFKEPCFEFRELKFDGGNYDLDGWFQSERYFDIAATRRYFSFKEDFVEGLKQKMQSALSSQTILISIRRGDFVDHPDYFQLPSGYYLNALNEHFPDWRQYSLIIMSDDPEYCKFHFGFLSNVYFTAGFSAVEQLGVAALCDHFIISNSTFSWWCAWLGEKEHSKIIRPLHYFTPAKRAIDDDRDYFPQRWVPFDHTGRKMSLRNAVICLEKRDPLLRDYLLANFEIGTQHIYEFPAKPLVHGGKWIFINDAVPPPLAVYTAVDDQDAGSIFLQKGALLNISRSLDACVLVKQHDFGIFSSQLRDVESTEPQIIFSCVPGYDEDVRNWSFAAIGKSGSQHYKIFYTYAGKIKGFPECIYYLAKQKKKALFVLKQFVKWLIRYRKK
ncbi:hypothetical protein HYN48_06680 [Flavobacterium magnum]|uniref:Alpha-1,2-fucosyltransferase n=1 Tax=Flavobacterium magnum TaxID=2162713 RepID=A0A2S0RDN0_9FLAO|nr:alpha-1,2-fucosyltransferase [Flavobacterium magnum]AWA29786.1 hypothetical protein HYN48_06680 [Flavobacterium magnum]